MPAPEKGAICDYGYDVRRTGRTLQDDQWVDEGPKREEGKGGSQMSEQRLWTRMM